MVSRNLPNFAYGVRDLSGLDEYSVIFAVSPASLTAPGEGEDEGVLFGAWSAEGDLVALVYGSWSGTALQYAPQLEAWGG
jgi:hypothetical protein